MDKSTPFKMPPFTGRNILIFSDGTGQAGGLMPDEVRSNVYKLFRATRCGPDTKIDPDKQLAFYDPGLGSKAANGGFKIGWMRWIYNLLSSATGLGISRNIEDCYAALIYLWRPGDHIFLFGFSRGAYTVRCLGGVLGLCGIPTAIGTERLRRDPDTVRRIAKEAVQRVYRHGSGASDEKNPDAIGRKDKLRQQRDALGKQFREKYSSNGEAGPNAIPHFIGVWDTVAAVGLSPPAMNALRIVAIALVLPISVWVAWLRAGTLDSGFAWWFIGTVVGFFAIAYGLYLTIRLKFVVDMPGYNWWDTVHLTSFKMTFFDRSLNKNVRYARHALAIDEMRTDFDRVGWVNDGAPPNREIEEGAWFQQYWFAGNHSDIGGSYPENESRLSDLALSWMTTEAKRAGLLVNDDLLILFGRSNGPQHDECRVGVRMFGKRFNWREKSRKMVDNATIHWSVKQRFDGPPVLVYDIEKPYRPALLRSHEQFSAVYEAEAKAKDG
jgi:uncharacterized protein (DUF2235 family)